MAVWEPDLRELLEQIETLQNLLVTLSKPEDGDPSNQFFLSFFRWLEATQERTREVGQGRASCACRASGRSEAESLDEPRALRHIVPGKIITMCPGY